MMRTLVLLAAAMLAVPTVLSTSDLENETPDAVTADPEPLDWIMHQVDAAFNGGYPVERAVIEADIRAALHGTAGASAQACPTPYTIPLGGPVETCDFECDAAHDVTAGGDGFFDNSFGVVVAVCAPLGLASVCIVAGPSSPCNAGVLIVTDGPGVCIATGLAIRGDCSGAASPAGQATAQAPAPFPRAAALAA